MTDRFIIEHGVVHDIKTGRHLTQAIEDDYPQQLCDLLNEQERTIDGYREALLVLVELKRFKRQIEAGTANADMKRYYEANKEGAWLAAEAMLVGCVRTEELPKPLFTEAMLFGSLVDWCHETFDLRAYGVSRMADNEQAILVSFSRKPSDDELRALHEVLAGRVTKPVSPQAPKP